MRIGVDGWRLQGPRTGVGTYLSQILRNWSTGKLPSGVEVNVYTPSSVEGQVDDLPANLNWKVLGPRMDMLPWQSLRLGPAVRDDVLLCPSYTIPLVSRVPTVAVVFEATQKLFPEEYSARTRYINIPLYGLSARRASRVVTCTNAARDDIVRAYGTSPDRITVIPMAPGSAFRPVSSPEARRAIRARLLGGDEPFFLHVGKLTRRRNVPSLMRAFAEFSRSGGPRRRLVVVGLRTLDLDLGAMARDLGIEDVFTHMEHVPLADLADLYAAAEAFVLPYTYEALSLTALEAQASGTPVIVTDTPGLREQTGGAALYLPDVSVPAICAALLRLSADSEMQGRLRAEGLAHASGFTWEGAARRIAEVLLETGMEARAR